MFFFRPTLLDLMKMLWWGIWNPPPKLQPVPVQSSHCPFCKRAY